jgi:hypothetical protein
LRQSGASSLLPRRLAPATAVIKVWRDRDHPRKRDRACGLASALLLGDGVHRLPIIVVTVLALCATASADGLYFTESFGVAMGRGELAPHMGNPMHLRVAVGGRLGNFALEPWVTSDLQTDRVGAWKGIVGGDPAEGSADLATYGVDAKYIFPIDVHLSSYVRAGASIVDGLGSLEGYSGRGLGFGGGFQISGKVRALGFLWAPLFFLNRGPKITGAIYLDQGYDFYRLRMAGAPTIHAHVGHVSVGFAVGSSF